MSQQKTKGYVIVASQKKTFYSLACNLVESILDFSPEAKITLVTEERFVDARADVCDRVLFCTNHYRAKLWGMANSPYDITFYIDADMECVHVDIATVFDNLQDRDMVFTPISKENDYAFVFRFFNEEFKKTNNEYYSFKHNGGVCLYDMTNPLVKQFMQEWWDLYQKQRNDYEWWPTDENGEKDFVTYPQEMRFWDQFTLWWLLHESGKYDELNVGFFDDWPRWNYYHRYSKSRTQSKDPTVLIHYSSADVKQW